jgi:hypothetical protein
MKYLMVSLLLIYFVQLHGVLAALTPVRHVHPSLIPFSLGSQRDVVSLFILFNQGVTKRCRLSWLTNSALEYEPKCGGVHVEPKLTLEI